ncbi:MAG TPA: hypothetical protein DCY20_02435, partial [Firmicutes bacterium]|nr:hypothetical protein [Bacillota bacterium]
MKKIIVINGSGKGQDSTTLKITNAFLEGFKLIEDTAQIEFVHLAELSFNHCTGCQICSQITPGKCQFQDDLSEIVLNYSKADIIIQNWPLHFYSVGSLMEKFFERLNPILSYVKTHEDEEFVGLKRVVNRTDADNIVMISTCSAADVRKAYEGVTRRLNTHLDNKGTRLFFQNTSYSYTRQSINGIDFYKAISWAGQDFARHRKISTEVEQILDKFIQSSEHEIFVTREIAYDEFFNDPTKQQENRVIHEKLKKMFTFYQPSLLKESNRVLEIKFTSLKETYHILLNEDEVIVLTKGERIPDCTIQTTFLMWQNLTSGKVKLFDACQRGELTFNGDKEIMIAIDNGLLYRPEKKEEELSLRLSSGKNKKWVRSKMNHWIFFLLPWIYTYIVISPFSNIAFLTVPLVVIGIYLLKKPTDTTFIDRGNVILLILLTILKLFLVDTQGSLSVNSILMIAFVLLGGLFSCTLFTKIPLTAYLGYDKYFKDINSVESYLNKHRLMTYLFATVLILMPVQAGIGYLLNIKWMNLWIIGYLVLC